MKNLKNNREIQNVNINNSTDMIEDIVKKYINNNAALQKNHVND
jgi:hypothetical protein